MSKLYNFLDAMNTTMSKMLEYLIVALAFATMILILLVSYSALRGDTLEPIQYIFPVFGVMSIYLIKLINSKVSTQKSSSK